MRPPSAGEGDVRTETAAVLGRWLGLSDNVVESSSSSPPRYHHRRHRRRNRTLGPCACHDTRLVIAFFPVRSAVRGGLCPRRCEMAMVIRTITKARREQALPAPTREHAESLRRPSVITRRRALSTRRVGGSAFQRLPFHPPVLLGVLRLRSCSPRPAKALAPSWRSPARVEPGGDAGGQARARERGPVIQQPDERAQGEEDGGRARSSFCSGPLQQPS